MPIAMGKSKLGPSFFTSAGACYIAGRMLPSPFTGKIAQAGPMSIKKPKTLSAAIYARQSRDDVRRVQASEPSLSINQQVADGHALCKREGYKVVHVLVEPPNTS